MSTRTNAPSDSLSSTIEPSAGDEGFASVDLPSQIPARSYATAVAVRVGREIRRLAFWIAVLLPLVYLSAFVAGLAKSHPVVLAGLVALNGIAVVAGHSHNRPDGSRRP